jgi:hypothetical protein
MLKVTSASSPFAFRCRFPCPRRCPLPPLFDQIRWQIR